MLIVDEILGNRPTLVIRNSPPYKRLNSNDFLWPAFNETSLMGPVGWPNASPSLHPSGRDGRQSFPGKPPYVKLKLDDISCIM
jgi:hypothetical protein